MANLSPTKAKTQADDVQILKNHGSLRQWLLFLATMLLSLLGTLASPVHAQPAYSLQPPSARPTGVSAVYTGPEHVSAQATIVPGPEVTPPGFNGAGSAVANPMDNAKPLEGGEIIARVDGQIVLAGDVMWQVNKIIDANRDKIPPAERDRARQMLLRQQTMGLIDTKLLYADFRRKVPAENIPTVEENLATPFEEVEMPRLVKMFELEDQRELDAELQKLGTSLAEMQRQFNERTIAGEWLRQLAPKPEEVTYDDLVAYYKQNVQAGEYDYPAQAKWEELMVRFDRFDGDRSAAWRAIAEMGNQVWKRVAANPGLRGAVFAELAKKKSHGFTANQGGGHDWTTKGALRNKELDEALFSLELGQLSNIIEFDQAFYIVRVLERKEAGRTPFTEAQADIRKKLESKRRSGIREEVLIDLRKKSRVWTIFDGHLSGPRLSELLNQPKKR